MKCDDRQCVQCYPVAKPDGNFWRVVIYVTIALLALLAVLSYRYAPGDRSDKSYGSNAMEKSK